MTDLSDRVYQAIPGLTLILIGLITTSSFILSYVVLVELAKEAGIQPLLAPLWPLCLDFFMLCASLFVLRKTIAGESALYGWGVIILCTGLSIAFNVIHAPEGVIYQIMYAIPPAFVCVSFEMFLSLLRKSPGKEKTPSPAQLRAPRKEPTPEDLPVTAPPRAVIEEEGARGYHPQASRILEYVRARPGSTQAGIARELGVSRDIVRYHVGRLVSLGLLVKGPDGLQEAGET